MADYDDGWNLELYARGRVWEKTDPPGTPIHERIFELEEPGTGNIVEIRCVRMHSHTEDGDPYPTYVYEEVHPEVCG